MHVSAMKRMEWFIENYIPKDQHLRVLDVGSYDVNGCYKSLFNNHDVEYVGLDLEAGPNVDIIPKDPYGWSFTPRLEDETFDFVISGSAFEHIEYPWLTMKCIRDVLKPDGYCCILTPFNLGEHRYPTDCYRYYPDGMKALAKYAGLQVVQCTTGGVPKDYRHVEDLDKWIHNENYDDTMLIAKKGEVEDSLPKFTWEYRQKQMYGSTSGDLHNT